MERDIIKELKELPFSRRNIKDKRYIITLGRPTPTLLNKYGKRSFQVQWYEQIDWLCGSIEEKKLFCWPCLLFEPKHNQSWTDKGYGNYKNLLSDSKYHSKSRNHLHSYKCLKMFGSTDIRDSLSDTAKLEKKVHNQKVEENRQYLKRLVSAVLYLCKQELPMRGHDESNNSINRGNYRELLEIFSEIDNVFGARLHTKEGSNHFTGVSSVIQNEIIEAINKVIENEIRNEINEAPFISVQADETTDCSVHAQLSIIVRYVTDFTVNERFLGFYDVSEDKSAARLTDVIESVLNSYCGTKSKIVSQTYDGAAVMSGNLNGVQMKLKEKGYENAHFIHCYAHKLNLVLSRSAEKVTGVKLFFSQLRSFSKFTSSSSKRKSVFRDNEISIPSLCETRWCYRSRTVSCIKNKLENLRNAFQFFLENSENWDNDTISQADFLLGKLGDFTFMFLLNCFNSFLSQAEKLFDILQCKELDMKYAHEKINDFIEFVSKHRTDEHYEILLQETKNDIGLEDISMAQRIRGKSINYKEKYFDIIESMLLSLQERFAQVHEFSFIELVDVSKFKVFANVFPIQHINALKEKYPNFFDISSLINELQYMYNDTDFKQCTSSYELLQLFYKLTMLPAMSETVKLIKLLLTIPVTSVSSERSFSTLDRIKSFLRSTMAQERLSALARISIERQLLNELDTKKVLQDRILEEFALKPRRLEFMFK